MIGSIRRRRGLKARYSQWQGDVGGTVPELRPSYQTWCSKGDFTASVFVLETTHVCVV